MCSLKSKFTILSFVIISFIITCPSLLTAKTLIDIRANEILGSSNDEINYILAIKDCSQLTAITVPDGESTKTYTPSAPEVVRLNGSSAEGYIAFSTSSANRTEAMFINFSI